VIEHLSGLEPSKTSNPVSDHSDHTEFSQSSTIFVAEFVAQPKLSGGRRKPRPVRSFLGPKKDQSEGRAVTKGCRFESTPLPLSGFPLVGSDYDLFTRN